jgi:peptidoglycan/LPS O-acetylase OafA/YrhL
VAPLRFLIRRGLKIYPAFYTFIALSLTISLCCGLYTRPELARFGDVFPRPSPGRLLGEVLFLQNYTSYLWGHTWSLAIEEHFYIGLACIVAMSVRWRKDPTRVFSFVPQLVLTVGIALLVARVILGYGLHRPWWQILPLTHLRIDSLLFGVLLSYYYHLQHAQTVALVRRFRRWLAAVAAAMVLPALVLSLDSLFMHTFGFTLLYLAFGCMIMLLRVWDTPRRDSLMHHTRVASYLGRHSYSIYLWHMPMSIWSVAVVNGLTGGPNFVFELVLYMGGTIVVGTGMSLLVEQPVLRMRDRFFPSKVGAAV